MNPIESRILSTLRPGDMVRFILRSDRRGRLSYEIEGDESDAGTGTLASRLQLLLDALRREGYSFASDSPDKTSAGIAEDRSGSRRDPHGTPGRCRWVEIRPRSARASILNPSALGFHAGAAKGPAESEVVLPELHAWPCPSLVDCLASLIAGNSQIIAFEIEFTREDLPDDYAEALKRALRLQVLAEEGARREPAIGVGPARAFLTLWLARRGGLIVRARARVPAAKSRPSAVLELVGREIFGAECEVVVPRRMTRGGSPSAVGRIDLTSRYPMGWSFPPVLPPPDFFDLIEAGTIHNLRLPALPATGTRIGTAEGRAIRLPMESRDRHTYIVGAPGTGKSTLLLRMIREDMARGDGVVVLDPHGDLFRETLEAVPGPRRQDLLTIDPLADTPPVGLNLLDMPRDRFFPRRAELLVGELLRFFKETWADVPDAFGPMFEIYYRNTLLLMLCQKAKQLTLMDFERTLSNEKFRHELLESCEEKGVCSFWADVAEKVGGEASLRNVVPYIISKLSPLTQGAFIRDLIGHERDELRLGARMDRNAIVLVNLNKGILGSHESALLGRMLTMQMFAAGLQRSIRPPHERAPVNIYIDEFQNFVSDNIASMLSEARKFGLRLHLANQTLGQLRAGAGRQNVLESVLGNVGNMILFRLGVPDSERLQLFLDPFTREEIQELPNFHALVRLLTAEGPVRPVVMRTLKP